MRHKTLIFVNLLFFCIIAGQITHPAIKIVEQERVVYRDIQINEADSFIAECTAYTAGYESTGKTPNDADYGITASGEYVRKGIIAADTRFLPMHSKVYIQGMGVYEVKDVGGAIVGNRIDIYFENLSDAINFGRQMRKVIVLERG